jgi:DNA-binding beta-propeller fold protein YncE
VGSPHYHLEYSQSLAIDRQDHLLLSHPGDFYVSRHSVQLVDQQANLLMEFGEEGSELGQFETPAGIAVWNQPCPLPQSEACSDRILVVDSGNNRLQAFDTAGNFVSAYGQFGSGSSQFNDPQGIAIDRAGRIIVVDRGNNRLKALSFDGEKFSFIRHFTANFSWPTGVAADDKGQLIVADSGNSKIKLLNLEGQLTTEYSGPNDGYLGNFNWPQGVAVDTKGNIIVADTGNRRVVAILAIPPQAAFTATPLAGTAPLQVHITDHSTGNITHWLWNFGDGTSATLPNPVHTYTTPGEYPLSLTVSGPGGTDQQTLPKLITVSISFDIYLPLIIQR